LIYNRYLIDFNTKDIETEYHDVLIIGSGIAGVYTALEIPEEFDIAIITKETIDISNSVLAQGGIAVSLDKEDSPELHFRDTLNAGAGLCDEKSVWVLVNEAAENIECIQKFGVQFDKKGSDLALTREGAHSMNRIIHAGDTTGKEVCDKLMQR
jgi:L-aspartate oxidase